MGRLKKFKFRFPIHPFLLAVFPVLFLYSNNINEVFLDVLSKPILFALIATVVSFFMLSLVFKNQKKVAVIISLFLILFFSYGHVKTFVIDLGSDNLLLYIWLVIFLFSVYLIVRTNKNLNGLSGSLNVTSAILVGFSLINIIYFEVSTNRISRLFENDASKLENISGKLTKPKNPPDIYYLVFDRYASFKTIEDAYKYDISEFNQYLTNKGFYIATESHSNYPRTFLSLGSSLNMEYVNYLTEEIGEGSNDEATGYYLLEDYKVQEILKSLGYNYIHIGGWWEPTRKNENADKNLFYNPFKFAQLELDEFSTKLVETTILSELLTKMSQEGLSEPLYGRSNHREGSLFQFNKLNEVAEKARDPKFVFAHFLMPHFPYVFDKNCDPITKQQAKSKSTKENYLNQLACTNKKIKTAVDNILEESGGFAIIILQADEGPDPINGKLEKQWQKSDLESVKEKTSILNAYYFPDKEKGDLYPSITPVNSFRLLFNLYFGANFDTLEDKIYVIENKDRPYKFFDVTEKVKGE